jgi:peptidoglycan/xylan/chitin deacetylase (PgdA/CDA1 family)
LCPLHADIAIAGEYPKQISITIDDVDINGLDAPTLSLDQRNEAIIHALSRAKLQAAIFVCGMRVDNDAGRRHLLALSQQGHIIGNHTYSHFEYSSVGFETFSKDVLRGEDVIRGYAGFRKLLRFPYLKEGDTVQERDQMRAFMKEHGYANGYVTIDASDWAIDARLRKRLHENPNADTEKYRDFYIEHIAARSEYYDELARSVLHRPIKHTLLIHHNLLAALFLNDLIDGLKGRGWKFINADEAYRDPVSRELPHSIPAGEALVYALAKDSGRFEGKLRYPAEDGRYEDKRMDELGL